jgi:hypothetical protein
MKKTFLIAAVSVFAISAYGQTNQAPLKKTGEQKPKQEIKKEFKYYCPKCFLCDSKSGLCRADSIPLIMTEQKYCPACYWVCCESSENGEPGKCHKCGTQLKKMEAPKKEEKGAKQKPKVKE